MTEQPIWRAKPPTRVAADPTHQHWFPQVYKLDVYLNGEKLRWCIDADSEEGRVIVLRVDGASIVYDNEGQALTDTLYGQVEIRWHDDE